MAKLIVGENDFETWCKINNKTQLLEEWDYEKKLLKPYDIAPMTNKNYWWKCELGHEYEASPNGRASRGRGCPYCKNQKVLVGYNDLNTIYPEIASEWDYEKMK